MKWTVEHKWSPGRNLSREAYCYSNGKTNSWLINCKFLRRIKTSTFGSFVSVPLRCFDSKLHWMFSLFSMWSHGKKKKIFGSQPKWNPKPFTFQVSTPASRLGQAPPPPSPRQVAPVHCSGYTPLVRYWSLPGTGPSSRQGGSAWQWWIDAGRGEGVAAPLLWCGGISAGPTPRPAPPTPRQGAHPAAPRPRAEAPLPAPSAGRGGAEERDGPGGRGRAWRCVRGSRELGAGGISRPGGSRRGAEPGGLRCWHGAAGFCRGAGADGGGGARCCRHRRGATVPSSLGRGAALQQLLPVQRFPVDPVQQHQQRLGAFLWCERLCHRLAFHELHAHLHTPPLPCCLAAGQEGPAPHSSGWLGPQCPGCLGEAGQPEASPLPRHHPGAGHLLPGPGLHPGHALAHRLCLVWLPWGLHCLLHRCLWEPGNGQLPTIPPCIPLPTPYPPLHRLARHMRWAVTCLVQTGGAKEGNQEGRRDTQGLEGSNREALTWNSSWEMLVIPWGMKLGLGCGLMGLAGASGT